MQTATPPPPSHSPEAFRELASSMLVCAPSVVRSPPVTFVLDSDETRSHAPASINAYLRCAHILQQIYNTRPEVIHDLCKALEEIHASIGAST